ncbi:MAG: hypothetical protein ACI9SI_001440 [Polaribacter sp.]|jgi:hypothetical protein
MLEIRPTCEHCNTSLPFDSQEAMMCTFECTYCKNCVETVLQQVCPNCSGSFSQRPIRPEALLEKYPVSRKIIHKPVDIESHLKRIQSR